MTETQLHYTTPGNHNLPIPSREEFHKYAMEKLWVSDFCTESPNEYLIGNIERSIRWTKKHARKENYAIK